MAAVRTNCNKVDGSCPGCKAGFQNPVLGCKTECKVFHFDEDCHGDCRIQCAGTECTDKSTGACECKLHSIWGKYEVRVRSLGEKEVHDIRKSISSDPLSRRNQGFVI
ncbi:hypothetical protein Btru_073685 [Bulinus truncatus]|nr:hypothetical protein Btru_073685 [Bulinus truncatus]